MSDPVLAVPSEGIASAVLSPLSMRRSRLKLLVLLLVTLAVIATALYLRRQLQIDACLDRGGRWDYEQRTCDDD